MNDLLLEIAKNENIKDRILKKKLSGLFGASKSAVISSLALSNKKILIITSTTKEALWIKQEISVFNSELQTLIFPSPDTLPGEALVSAEIYGERLFVLNKIFEAKELICIAPIRALMYKTDKDFQRKIILKKSQKADFDKIVEEMSLMGYKRLSAVGERGEFSVRGGIIDVFPSNSQEPCRVEFFGDKIDSIRAFDPVSQRSKKNIEEIVVLKNFENRDSALVDFFEDKTLLVIDEEISLKNIAERFEKDVVIFDKTKKEIETFGEIIKKAKKKNYIEFSSLLEPSSEGIFYPPPSFLGKVEKIADLKKRVKIITQHSASLNDIPHVLGSLRGGFGFGDFLILSDKELFGVEPLRPKEKSQKTEGLGEAIRADFKNGDYVVHEDYGIGIYRGLQTIEEGEYILIEFAFKDKLYVPSTLMGKLEKYVSEEGFSPKLSKLGSASWTNLKTKVKKSIKDLTQDLLILYAERKKATKIPFPPDDVFKKDLEDSFPYEETGDQLRAIKEITQDQESAIPMDRLLCGDVGYGKTEVALRAVVKAAAAGKQVAFLVPTTILAEQHFHYFSERLKPFPLKIASLSRFRKKTEQKEITEKLKEGEIDIVIGTHRILQKDVNFKDLGLIVVDEEHRFGVEDKEKLKKLKKSVDVLSMTATPIPRTLYLSLSGTRDLSLIQTPPSDRSPVRTYIVPFNDTLIREAALREFDRGGQIFFVHNRIETINSLASKIKKIVPDSEIAIAHGRMHEKDLERVMEDFLSRKFNILLCTSIIESGLDMPNVNTIFIDKADKLGLAQLYQLKGRVGRSSSRAYAYLLYHPEELSTENALSRLQAIQEFTSFGSGYKLALRDLEIRGSGNILGSQQHGHMLSVGFDLYCEMLEEAVKEIKGEKTPTPRQVVIDIGEDAFIPKKYVDDDQQRIALYRKLNTLGSKGEINEFKEELKDRFGPIPKECEKLFSIVGLKVAAQAGGIRSIKGTKNIIVHFFDGRVKKLRLSTSDKIREIKSVLSLKS